MRAKFAGLGFLRTPLFILLNEPLRPMHSTTSTVSSTIVKFITLLGLS